MRKKMLISKILRAQVPAKFFLGIAALAAMCFFSCKKDSNLGLAVQPSADLLNSKVTDTTTVVAWTHKEDSLNTSGYLSNYVLGSYWDPTFGKVKASIYTQFVLPGSEINFDFAPGQDETKLSCDSLVLSLSYSTTYYGDTTSAQTFTVYQMTNQIALNTAYKSDTAVQVYQVPLGSKTFYPKPHSRSVPIKGDTAGAQVRITLDKSLGQLILNQSGQAGLANNTNFLKMLNGLYIKPETNLSAAGKGAMLYLPMTDPFTKLTLYYKNYNLTSPVDTSVGFEVNTNAARFERFDHDYTVAAPLVQAALVAAKQSIHPAQQVVYVSSLSGLKTKLDFPYLKNWNKVGAISINKAELTLKVIPDISSGYPVYPSIDKLTLVTLDSLGHEVLVPDYLEGTDYFGGTYDPINQQYVFHIDRYVQQILTGKQVNRGLYLIATNSDIAANRVVLGGGNNTAGYALKFRLSYTKLH
jgi:hypothetical protein